MKLILVLMMTLIGHGLWANTTCSNPNALRVGKFALNDLQKMFPDAAALDAAVVTESCGKGWGKSIFPERDLTVYPSLANMCGVQIPFSSAVEEKQFLETLLDMNYNADFMTILDIYSEAFVPVCGQVF